MFRNNIVRPNKKQTYSVHELIIVNDGGDETYIKSVLPKDERIKYFSKINEGVARTRNYAIEKATGDYIAFLDQDDLWYDDKLEHQVQKLNENDHCSWVVTKVDIVDELNSVIHKRNSKLQKRFKSISISNFRNELLNQNFIYSSTPLISKKIFTEVGFFDPNTKPHDDWNMYLRILLHGFQPCLINESLSTWRFHGNNESQNIRKMLSSKYIVYKKIKKSFPEYSKQIEKRIQKVRSERAVQLMYKKKKYRMFQNMMWSIICKYPSVISFNNYKRLCFSYFTKGNI